MATALNQDLATAGAKSVGSSDVATEPGDVPDMGLDLDFEKTPSLQTPAGGKTAWLVHSPERGQFGPMTITELRELIRTRQLSPTALVWHEGMPAWVVVKDTPEFTDLCSDGAAALGPAAVVRRRDAWDEIRQWLSGEPCVICSQPRFFRICGRTGGVLALVTLLGSLVLWFWGKTWFIGVVGLCLVFLLGEAIAAVLECLACFETRNAGEAEAGEATKDQ